MPKARCVKGPYERAVVAIASGDTREAARQVEELNRTALKTHDRLVGYVSLLLSFIAQEMGEEKVRDAWRYVIERVHKKGLLALKGKPHSEIVNVLLDEHLAHGSDFTIEEEPNKTTFVLDCCGSGGRLRGDRSSAAEGKLRNVYSWGFGRKGVSYYCAHCGIVSQESPGWGAGFRINIKYGEQFDQKGNPIADPCRFELITDKTGA